MTRPTPKQFIEDLTRDLIANPGSRPEIMAGYAKHMEAREEAIRQENKSLCTVRGCRGHLPDGTPVPEPNTTQTFRKGI